MSGNLFMLLVTVLQFGAAIFYLRDKKYPDAMMLTCFGLSNIAIIWRNA